VSGPWISSTTLPRSAGVTDALLWPVAAPGIGAQQWEELAGQLRESLRTTTGGRRLRIDGYRLARGVAASGNGAFSWSPRNARRLIGVKAVGSVVEGRASNPAAAVALEERRLLDLAVRAPRPGSLAEWLATSSTPVRAAARGSAITWSTRLLGALDFERLAGRVSVGGPDRWWDGPGVASVSLRGRADVVASLGEREAGSWSAFSMLGGRPGPASRVELGLLALVAGLRAGHAGLPDRVVGYWPDCGRTLVLPVDHQSLAACAAAVTGIAVVQRPSALAPAA
jgi:hypothetical protein